MFGKRQKQALLDLRLPAIRLGALPEAPSVRIMRIANMRAWCYGMLVANIMLAGSAVLFFFVMTQRVDVDPYVADGSSYGCAPAVYDGQPSAPIRNPEPTSPATRPVMEPLSPIVSGEL